MRQQYPRIYVATQREMRGYDVEHGTTWSFLIGNHAAVNVRDLVVARGHVLAITEPHLTDVAGFRDEQDETPETPDAAAAAP